LRWVRCSVRTFFAPTLGALQTSGGNRVPEAVALVANGKFTWARSRTPSVLWVTIFGRHFFKRDCRGLDSHYRIEQPISDPHTPGLKGGGRGSRGVRATREYFCIIWFQGLQSLGVSSGAVFIQTCSSHRHVARQ
jgi:hypothetical protein